MLERDQFAGFWRRFIALIIDWNLALLVLFPCFVLGGLLFPKLVLVEVPYDLFTEVTTLDESQESFYYADGSFAIIEEFLVEELVLGKWRNVYLKTDQKIANQTETNWQLVDPSTREPINLVDTDDFLFLFLLVYWTIAESGSRRGSIGKRIMGIEVLREDSSALTWRRALVRNLGKIFSAIFFMIGFMMVGWSNRKQGLHDKMASCIVKKRKF